ncbi:acyl-CoA dehydrogenase [Nocardioides sambongensis]|uniref:acyl-CoA dehydrogenase n=1 Tax=Nocardioides sambongensis TaxID=2589074 RepID=UPI00112C8046|nr:acyl-CoA dehydrogenase [Nocardioides sambongensis]
MDFDLSAEQRDLAAAAADFLADAADLAAARAALDEAGAPTVPVPPGRKGLVQSGFAAITVPEADGGGGGTLLDLAVVAEQAGRVLAGPSLVTYARAAELLVGDHERLGGLVDGSLAVAVHDGGPVLDGLGADRFLARRGDDVVLAAGTVTPREPIDATRGLAEVALGDAEVVATGAADRWARAERIGRVVLAAEGLGAAARAVEIGVAYTKERHAFGRPIGSYQAVKHALVDAYVEVEQLRSLVWWAAWTADEDPAALPLASAAVKAAAASALERAAETLIQVHGGIGFTWEHDAHLYWRRAKVDRLLLGDEVAALDEVSRIALDTVAGAGR